eukprot:gene18290-20113_t
MEEEAKMKNEEEARKKKEAEEKKIKDEEEKKKKEEEQKRMKEEAETKRKEEEERAKEKIAKEEEERKKKEEEEQSKKEAEENWIKQQAEKVKKQQEEKKKEEEEENLERMKKLKKKKEEEANKKKQEEARKKKEAEEKRIKEQEEKKKKEEEQRKMKEEAYKKQQEEDKKVKEKLAEEEKERKRQEDEEQKKKEAAEKWIKEQAEKIKKEQEETKKIEEELAKQERAKKEKENMQKFNILQKGKNGIEDVSGGIFGTIQSSGGDAEHNPGSIFINANSQEGNKGLENKFSQENYDSAGNNKVSDDKGVDYIDYLQRLSNGKLNYNKNMMALQGERSSDEEEQGFEKVGPQQGDLLNDARTVDDGESKNGNFGQSTVDSEEWTSMKNAGANATIENEDSSEGNEISTEEPSQLNAGKDKAALGEDKNSEESGLINKIEETISGMSDKGLLANSSQDDNTLFNNEYNNAVNQYKSISERNRSVAGSEYDDHAISRESSERPSSVENLSENIELFGSANAERKSNQSSQPRVQSDGNVVLKRDRQPRYDVKKKKIGKKSKRNESKKKKKTSNKMKNHNSRKERNKLLHERTKRRLSLRDILTQKDFFSTHNLL